MSFQEKSTWVMGATMLVAYGWYFSVVISQLDSTVFRRSGYQSVMLVAVGILVALAVMSHILIAFMNPKGADSTDERDREINRFGEYIGGYVLGAGALFALALAMIAVEQFWIANAILLALVVSELVSAGTRVVLYRRGF